MELRAKNKTHSSHDIPALCAHDDNEMTTSSSETALIGAIRDGVRNVYGGHSAVRIQAKPPLATFDFIPPANALTLSSFNEMLAVVKNSSNLAATFTFPDMNADVVASVGVNRAFDTSRYLIVRLHLNESMTELQQASPYVHVNYRSKLPFDLAASFPDEHRKELTKRRLENLSSLILFVLNMRRDMECVDVAVEFNSSFDVKLDFECILAVDFAFLKELRRRYAGAIKDVTLDGTLLAKNRLRIELSTMDFDVMEAVVETNEKKRVSETASLPQAKKKGGFLKALFGL
jgi:hypothetical protein